MLQVLQRDAAVPPCSPVCTRIYAACLYFCSFSCFATTAKVSSNRDYVWPSSMQVVSFHVKIYGRICLLPFSSRRHGNTSPKTLRAPASHMLERDIVFRFQAVSSYRAYVALSVAGFFAQCDNVYLWCSEVQSRTRIHAANCMQLAGTRAAGDDCMHVHTHACEHVCLFIFLLREDVYLCCSEMQSHTHTHASNCIQLAGTRAAGDDCMHAHILACEHLCFFSLSSFRYGSACLKTPWGLGSHVLGDVTLSCVFTVATIPRRLRCLHNTMSASMPSVAWMYMHA